MAQFQASQPLEGLSTTRPPFFDGTNYNYWKNRMKVFVLANVPKAWIVTMKGPYVPMKVVGEREVPKEEVEWNDEELGTQPLEVLSTTRPPFFDGTNYNYWKNRMKVFLLANVPKAWIVTMKGPYVPMKVVGEREVPKEEVEWNDEDLGKIMINNKAINML
ncbi:hypothetical protein SLEP1_g55749 [Rubroshorea leprosula]|uniref:DUF4219 domain-containing protein n=1 Tax=Rubroshorea leprosula TaxID=152421 RepID=A0AAV5MHI6_9ROSI|nr:hypothetical protein SLEP1_g55749 [Rubroshorea leprosula]